MYRNCAIRKTFDGAVALEGIDLSGVASGLNSRLACWAQRQATTLPRIVADWLLPGQRHHHAGGFYLSLLPGASAASASFQSYLLFPNMTVAENVGYGLRIRAQEPRAHRRAGA